MTTNVDPESESFLLETAWNEYCLNYKGRFTSVRSDCATVFSDIINAHTDTDARIMQLENMIERVINVLISSQKTEREIIDNIVKKMGE